MRNGQWLQGGGFGYSGRSVPVVVTFIRIKASGGPLHTHTCPARDSRLACLLYFIDANLAQRTSAASAIGYRTLRISIWGKGPAKGVGIQRQLFCFYLLA